MLTIYERVEKRLIFFASYFIACLLFRKNTFISSHKTTLHSSKEVKDAKNEDTINK